MMVNFISSWLKDIVVLFILISIAQLVMPKGNMKKYIDLIIGFLIIFTIITPFAKIVKKDFSFDQTVLNYSNSTNLSEKDELKFQLEQEKQIERLYKDKIKNEIIKLVEEETLYIVEDVSVDLKDEAETYGEIKYLKIIISEIDQVRKENKITIEKVELIDINKELPSKVNEVEEEYIELKKLIGSNYKIEEDKITITKYE